jgi:hypothetical protein
MTFAECLENLKPSRRGPYCRLYVLQQQVRTLAKRRGLSRRKMVYMLWGIVKKQWVGDAFMVFADTIDDVYDLVSNMLRMFTANVKRLLWYVAGLTRSQTFVRYLNRVHLRHGQHAAA